ncbi:unnamed protein product, partial [Iphiclides podalirius]
MAAPLGARRDRLFRARVTQLSPSRSHLYQSAVGRGVSRARANGASEVRPAIPLVLASTKATESVIVCIEWGLPVCK